MAYERVKPNLPINIGGTLELLISIWRYANEKTVCEPLLCPAITTTVKQHNVINSITNLSKTDGSSNSVPILSYSMTPWSRVLLEKLTGSAASQEIPRIFGTRRFLTVPTSARHLSLS